MVTEKTGEKRRGRKHYQRNNDGALSARQEGNNTEDTTVMLIPVLLWVKTSSDGQYAAFQRMELRISYRFTFYGVYVALFCFIGRIIIIVHVCVITCFAVSSKWCCFMVCSEENIFS